MVEHQGPRRYAACKVIVDGADVTARLSPYLISVQVIDTFEGSVDQCHIELDDRNAELQIPPDGGSLQVYLGWSGEGPEPYSAGQTYFGVSRGGELAFGGPGMQLVFSGTVTSCESGFTRKGGGRRLWIDATSSNVKGAEKEVQQGSWGEGKKDDSQQQGGGQQITLKQVLQDMAKKSGLEVKLSPQFENIKRDYWHVNDSIANFGQRMAHSLGGFFKIADGKLMLVGKDEGMNVDGDTLPTVEAVWGRNLIGWRIKPFVARPQHKEASEKFFKLFDAEWDHAMKAIGGSTPFGGSNATAKSVGSVVDQAVADQQNTGTKADSTHRRGTGWCLLNGEPRCKAGNSLHITGARPGVDGVYLIMEAEHNYTRGVGYQTRCNVRNPRPDYGGYPSWPKREEPTPEPEKPKAEQPIDLQIQAAEAAKADALSRGDSAEAAKWQAEIDRLTAPASFQDRWSVTVPAYGR